METKSDRKSRVESLRSADERARQIKGNHLSMTYSSPLNIPLDIIPEGWTYSWIRLGVLDIEDKQRDSQTKMMGYTPVPKDRHPELAIGGHLGSKVSDNFIIYSNLLLCEIPTVIVEERQKRMFLELERRMSQMRLTDQFSQGLDGIIPKVLGNDTYRDTTVTRARAPSSEHSYSM
jgi:hypothetical protein